MTLKNGFDKCSLFVFSANGWKDQNMDSSFSRQRKPLYGEGIVRLANRVEVWRQSEVSVDFWKVLGREVFSPERSLNQAKATRVCICLIYQPSRSLSFLLLFLFCWQVLILRWYENRSNNVKCKWNGTSRWGREHMVTSFPFSFQTWTRPLSNNDTPEKFAYIPLDKMIGLK